MRDKLSKCAAEQYGFGDDNGPSALDDAKMFSEIGAAPLYKPLVGLPVVGDASKFTNVLGATTLGLRLNPVLPGTVSGITKGAFGSVRAGTVLGRANVYVGSSLLLSDALSIATCATADSGGLGGGGGSSGNY
jgi:hypothetical protein